MMESLTKDTFVSKVYDYKNESITYFKDGIKFGTADFVK